MRFARFTFIAAGIWGIVVLAPLYFLVDISGRHYTPPDTYPQFFYGFLSVAMAWQIAFLMIGSNPSRFRLLMLPGIVEKLGYVATVAVLYTKGRVTPIDAQAAVPDAILGVLFIVAFLNTASSDATASSSRHAGRMGAVVLFLLCVATPALAQSPLSLSDAIIRAKTNNPDAALAAALERESAQRVIQARSGYLPKVDVTEAWQRGNSPGFAFSSLLAERQVVASSLTLDALNHPAVADNFQTTVSAEQPLFDRATSANIRTASIGQRVAAIGRQLVDQQLTMSVTDAFGAVLLASARVYSAAAMVETARADREMAGNRRDAGRVTDADVLQLDVYLARALAAHVQSVADERVARARLNQVMGEPLNTIFTLDATPQPIAIDTVNRAGLDAEAVRNRPEVLLARQQEQLAAAAVMAARATFLPQVAAQAGWELNGGVWNSRASAWSIGAVVRLNLFHGFADQARLAEAHQQVSRRAVERQKAETMARLDVEIALARLEAARASEAVGQAVAAQSRETHRIVRDRYATGLADIAALLRAADAVQQADEQQILARVNVLTATATLQRAVGKS